MSKKNTLVALDPSISYAVIGLDLAKADVAGGCQKFRVSWDNTCP